MTTRDDALQFGAVDWQRLLREGAVADQHAAAIKGTEASSLEAVLGDAAAARAYAAALAAVAGGVDDGAARRYCVTKAEDVLVADGAAAAKAQLFAPGGLANFVAAAGKAARAGDAYSTRGAAAVAAALVAADAQADAGPLVAWLATQMADGTSAREAAPALAVALRAPRARAAFAAQGGVALLAARLNDAGGGAQLKYEVAFSLWCLSFEEDAPDDFVRSHAVEALCGAVAAAPREKVVRVAVTALLNAARDDAAATRMVGAGLGTTLASMASRPFADDDVKAAVGELATRVKSVSKELSTLERYAAEVASGETAVGPGALGGLLGRARQGRGEGRLRSRPAPRRSPLGSDRRRRGAGRGVVRPRRDRAPSRGGEECARKARREGRRAQADRPRGRGRPAPRAPVRLEDPAARRERGRRRRGIGVRGASGRTVRVFERSSSEL